MRRIIFSAIVSTMAALLAATNTASAKPSNPGLIIAEKQSQAELVHHRHYRGLHFGFTLRSGHVYFRGYRGYVHPRKGYIFHHGYYFPHHVVRPKVVRPKLVRPKIIHPAPIVRLSASHVRWCYARYKTYRHYDNTYAYKVGKRTYCRSPYSH
ncbi:MAG: BA14K family protein [Pseudomonadota bacterium]